MLHRGWKKMGNMYFSRMIRLFANAVMRSWLQNKQNSVSNRNKKCKAFYRKTVLSLFCVARSRNMVESNHGFEFLMPCILHLNSVLFGLHIPSHKAVLFSTSQDNFDHKTCVSDIHSCLSMTDFQFE